MSLADLLFLAVLLATVVTVAVLGWQLARGRWAAARLVALGWGAGAALYFAVLLVVSLVQPARIVPLGQDECFDDWCIAVTAAERQGARLVVTLQVSNRGRGRVQAEPDAYVMLRDAAGREVAPERESDSATAPAIGDPVPAGQFLVVHHAFNVSGDAASFTLVKARRARFPGVVIIGDPTSLLHRPTLHALTLTATPRRG